MWRVKAHGLVSRLHYEYDVDLPPDATRHEVYSAACRQHGQRLVASEVGEHLDAGFGTYTLRLLSQEP